MKRLIIVFLCFAFLCSCGASATEYDFSYNTDKHYYVSRFSIEREATEETSVEEIKGIWVSQFDMHPIFRDGSKQRAEEDYRIKIRAMINNLVRDGFDTVFLQVRPNGDSMYESSIYPTSKYIAGVFGGEIDYDAIGIYLETAKASGLSVHAWINPFRLCSEDELLAYGRGILYEWYNEGVGKRVERGGDGLLYLDPAYEEATELIVSGAKEILDKYNFDGIHIDDYFYPTEFELDDGNEFKNSSHSDLGDFRRSNIDRTVKALYDTVHGFEAKVFGVSPAGNIYSLASGWYVDIYTWLSNDGFLDYVMPQLYFGFENAICPFEQVLADWVSAVKNDSIALYIGLSAAKCALGSEGEEDTYAGENGKFEWRDNKDILARSVNAIAETNADGVCVFTYSSFYDPLTGEGNSLTDEERNAFCAAIR